MSRRHDRLRRRDRKAREHHHVTAGPPDMTRAEVHWRAILSTLTGRGFREPPFAGVVFAPPVEIDLNGDDPPRQLREGTIAAIVAETLKQEPS
jgi:hypothetical protein